MSNQKVDAAQGDFPEAEASTVTIEQTFEATVNEALASMEQDDKGTWKFPDGTPEEVKYSAMAEKRRRDTQSALTKEQLKTKAIATERDKFRSRLEDRVQLNLSVEEAEELEDLKQSDQDAWRAKINEHETKAKNQLKQELDEDSALSGENAELERRTALLEEFNKANPAIALNDEVFENDIPPRISKKLANGEVSFEEFLVEAKEFLSKGKVTSRKAEDVEPNLNDVGGGGNVTDTEIKQDIVKSYKNEIY